MSKLQKTFRSFSESESESEKFFFGVGVGIGVEEKIFFGIGVGIGMEKSFFSELESESESKSVIALITTPVRYVIPIIHRKKSGFVSLVLILFASFCLLND